MRQLLKKISEVGSENGLTFSSHEILKQSIIGADGIHRKIVVIKKSNLNAWWLFNRPARSKNCSVKKVYGSIKAGELTGKNLEQHLHQIFLHFEFNNNKQPIDVSFYNHTENSIYQLEEMELKAKHWEIILTKMLKGPSKKIAWPFEPH